MNEKILRKCNIVGLYILAGLCLIPAIVDFNMGNRFNYMVLFIIFINLALVDSEKLK